MRIRTVFDEKLILSNLPLHIQRDAVYEKCVAILLRAFAVCLYVQQRSELQAQQLQARNKQQGGGGGGRENYGSGRREAWKLHFSEKLADDCWVLSNGELRGKLWSDKTQVRERVATNTLF